MEYNMTEREKIEMNSLRRMNRAKCNLGILWLEKKLEELEIKIEEPVQFEEDLMKHLEGSWRKVQSAAVISSAPTLFNVKHGKHSLKSIFEKHGIDVGNYIFCLTVTEREVIVSDGFGSPRKRVKYDKLNKTFYYDFVKGAE